jgi:hypothetical protein
MKNYGTNEAEFKTEIQIPEPTDPAHADVINTPIKQLFGNTVANKKAVEDSKEQVETKLQTFKNEISASQAELNKSLNKAIKDIADSNGASTTTFNTDGSIVSENSLEVITTTFNKADKSILEKHDYKNGTSKVLKTVFDGKTIRTMEVN